MLVFCPNEAIDSIHDISNTHFLIRYKKYVISMEIFENYNCTYYLLPIKLRNIKNIPC